jgi:hypothetical protein
MVTLFHIILGITFGVIFKGYLLLMHKYLSYLFFYLCLLSFFNCVTSFHFCFLFTLSSNWESRENIGDRQVSKKYWELTSKKILIWNTLRSKQTWLVNQIRQSDVFTKKKKRQTSSNTKKGKLKHRRILTILQKNSI